MKVKLTVVQLYKKIFIKPFNEIRIAQSITSSYSKPHFIKNKFTNFTPHIPKYSRVAFPSDFWFKFCPHVWSVSWGLHDPCIIITHFYVTVLWI